MHGGMPLTPCLRPNFTDHCNLLNSISVILNAEYGIHGKLSRHDVNTALSTDLHYLPCASQPDMGAVAACDEQYHEALCRCRWWCQ